MCLRLTALFLLSVFLHYPAYSASIATPDIMGKITYYQVREPDTLYDIARQHDIGIVELLAANPGVDPWMPEEGRELMLPTEHILPYPRKGIVINLSELRLYYYSPGGEVMAFPIGIGREGWQTPVTTTSIASKRTHPAWTPPASIRAENPGLPVSFPPGPDNPLGDYALDLRLKGILIHGTNRPYGVGKRSSHGCIRLYPEDIERLYQTVRVGTLVTIIDKPFKLGWRNNELFLEISPTQKQGDEIADYKFPTPVDIPEIYEAVRKMAGEDAPIDWYAVGVEIFRRRGIPVIIARRSK